MRKLLKIRLAGSLTARHNHQERDRSKDGTTHTKTHVDRPLIKELQMQQNKLTGSFTFHVLPFIAMLLGFQ